WKAAAIHESEKDDTGKVLNYVESLTCRQKPAFSSDVDFYTKFSAKASKYINPVNDAERRCSMKEQ
ncbi:MAG: hypothetical protein ACI4D5_06050, partial [Kineothrix sp.]